MTIPKIRQRVKHRKTRTGCRTCRQRHVKCDEARPECQNCVKMKQRCGGYEVPASTGSTALRLLPKQLPNAGAAALIFRNPMMLAVDMNSLESNAFDLFRLHTIHELPGCSRLMAWDRLTMPISYQEPAVAHAVIALAAIRMAQASVPEGVDACGLELVDRDQYHFALTQYNKAVVHLRGYISEISSFSDARVEVVLLLSLLFFSFDVFRADDAAARLHLERGIRILLERSHREQRLLGGKNVSENCRSIVMAPDRFATMDLLTQTFVRLDSDIMINDDWDALLKPICFTPIPKFFSTMDEAMVHLDVVTSEAYTLICHRLEHIACKHLKTIKNIEQIDEDTWTCLLGTAIRTCPLDSHPEIIGQIEQTRKDLCAWMAAHALYRPSPEEEIQYISANISFFLWWESISHCRSTSEMHYDSLLPQFEYAASLIERYFALSSNPFPLHNDAPSAKKRNIGISRPCLTAGTQITSCLYDIATKCRKSSVRRRAVSLMRYANLQGHFDGFWLAAFVEYQINKEEERARAITCDYTTVDLLPQDIPEEARILDAEGFDDMGDGVIRPDYYKMDYGKIVWSTWKDLNGTDGEVDLHYDFFNIPRPPFGESPIVVGQVDDLPLDLLFMSPASWETILSC